MSRKWVVLFLLLIILVSVVFVLSRWATATNVFSDDFSSGGFSNWSRTFLTSGSTQTVNGGVAQFVVPTPAGGTVSNSYLVKDGFTSTVNSTIVASQDILVTNVPSGCSQGNGAIFFLYICDSADLGGNYGNIGVGIDGSSVWSLWIGGSLVYTYLFQSAGEAPVSNTWYHVVLTIDNSLGQVSLAVDGVVVISASQQQFTDRSHAVSLMSGMGEAWWSDCVGPQEIDVDNVWLDISDAESGLVIDPTSSGSSSSGRTVTVAPTRVATPTPHVTDSPTVAPTIDEMSGLLLPLVAVVVTVEAVLLWRRRVS